MTLTEYIDYFKGLATNHVKIGASRFSSIDIEEVIGGLRTEIDTVSGYAFLLESPEGRIKAANKDFFMDEYKGAFQIVRAVQPDNFDQAREYMSEAKEIGIQVIARMYSDRQAGILKGFDPESAEYMDIKRQYDNAYGYRFEFELWDRPANCLKVDDSQWGDLP